MRHLTVAALVFTVSVPGLLAQQPGDEHSGGGPARMRFSGSTMSTALAIAPNTLNHETHVAGNGPLGPFTYRGLWADDPSSRTVGSCGSGFGPNFRIVAGGGVFRFEDGSLLTVQLTEGTLCVDTSDPTRPVGRQFETYLITGGTGRFDNAAVKCGATVEGCTLRLIATRGLVLRDAAGAPAMFTFTGEFQRAAPQPGQPDKLQ